MNKTLVISEAQSKVLLDLYLSKINEINTIVSPLLAERAEFEDLVNQLNGDVKLVDRPIAKRPIVTNLFASINPDEYQKSWSVPKKAFFVLNQYGAILSTSEAFELLLTYEPELEEKRRNVMVLLSGEYGDKAKAGKTYFRVGKNRAEYKYGLLDWKKEEVA